MISLLPFGMTRLMRYAIYFAPCENSGLWQAGCRWLGRDAASDTEMEQPGVPGMESATVRELTTAPRRYGFHATLKAPFRLTGDASPGVFLATVADFARRRKPFRIPRLKVERLGSFLALQIEESCEDLQLLASDCVREFDPFRAAESASDQARRAEGLGVRQRAHLETWGYPYVMDQWRFHMTLTNALGDSQLSILKGFLGDWFARVVVEPVWVRDLCVYVETAPGSNLTIAGRFPLSG